MNSNKLKAWHPNEQPRFDMRLRPVNNCDAAAVFCFNNSLRISMLVFVF